MTLEYRENSNGKPIPRLTGCPVCGADLTGGGEARTAHFVNEHAPQDFGLSPLGSRGGIPNTDEPTSSRAEVAD